MRRSTPTSSPATESALLPCPFCGGQPTLHDTTELVEGASSGDFYHCCDCGIVTGLSTTEAEAIAAWNRRPPVASPAGREEENNRLAAGAAPNPQDTQSPPATRANARQLDGWVIEAEVRTKTGILTWGFFESRGAAEQEASRFDLRALPATLILPPEAKIDDD